jgi:hypothetical protein
MRFFKRFFDFYINASLHIGLAVLALTSISESALTIPKQENLLLTIFFGTIFGYNALKYFDLFSSDISWLSKHRDISIVSFIAFFGAFFFYVSLPIKTQLSFLAIGFVIVVYPFLRKFGLLKMFLVSFCVAMITVYIPYIQLAQGNIDFLITLIQRFLIVISLLIPFEISDSKTDQLSLQTLPQQFGIRPTKIFGMLLVIPFLLLEFFKSNPSYSVLIVSIITVLFIHFSSVHRSKYYTSFWVESVPIFWWLLLFII